MLSSLAFYTTILIISVFFLYLYMLVFSKNGDFMSNNLTDYIASTLLGKKIEGSNFYNPDFLVAIPRSENREQYQIYSDNLPFCGFDVWHSYEFSALTKNSIPVTRVLKLVYSSDSEYIIESKSLKLYLNSFNMMNYGSTCSECLNICKEMIKKDLESKLQTTVYLDFIEQITPKIDIFGTSKDIMQCVDEISTFVEHFNETPRLLETEELNKEMEYFYSFDSLRSNCRVTHQPDFGDLFIYYKSFRHIQEASLVKYLTSFRSEYHFHEECCEMIYKRLIDVLGPTSKLAVCAMYTRRGGIDISPCRWSPNCSLDDLQALINTKVFARYGCKQ